jgi:hypothetical protein
MSSRTSLADALPLKPVLNDPAVHAQTHPGGGSDTYRRCSVTVRPGNGHGYAGLP